MSHAITNRSIPHAPAWVTTHAPAVAITLLLLLAGIAYAYNLAGWPISDDEGGYLYAAWRISAGEVPYRDFFTPQLPAFLYIGGLLFKLLGPSGLVARGATVLATLLAALLLYLTTRRLTGPWVALLAAAVFLVHDDVTLVAREYRPEAFMLLAVNAGIYCLVRADGESDTRWLVAAGVTFGLGLLAKLFAILPLAGWILFLGYQVLRRELTVRPAIRAVWTVLVPMGVVVGSVLAAFYVIAPQLPEAILFHHLRQGADMPVGEVMAKGADFLVRYAQRFAFLMLVAALGTVAAFHDPRRRLPLFAFQLPIALIFLFLSRELFDRQLVVLVPALAVLFSLGVGMIVDAARRTAGARWTVLPNGVRRVARPIAGGLLLGLAGLAVVAALRPMLAADRAMARRVDRGTLPLAAYIAAETRPDEVVITDYPGLNFLARRKTTYLGAGLSAGATKGGQITGQRLVEEMQSVPVKMVVLQDFTPVSAGQLVSLSDFVPFRGYVQGAYHFVGTRERGNEFHRVYVQGAPALEPLDVRFGDQLRLAGDTLEEGAVPSGQKVYLTLAWEALRQPERNYQIYLHLEDEQGHVWAIRDDLLVKGTRFQPTLEWVPGDRVEWGYGIGIPTGTPPGEYTLKLGVYAEDDPAARLLPLDETGRPAGVEYPLARVRVLPEQRDPDFLQPPAYPSRPPRRVQTDGLALMGYDLGRAELNSGEVLGVRLFWRARRALDADYRVRLRVPGAAPDLIATLGGTEYPTRLWTPDQAVAGWYDLQTGLAAAGEYPLLVNVLDPNGQPQLPEDVELTRVQINPIQRQFSVPEIQHPLPVTLEDGISLLGYDLAVEDPAPGGHARLTLYWQAQEEPKLDYNVFVHLVDGAGQLRGQADHVPAGGTRPTGGWLPGEVVRDEFELPISAEATPGEYRVKIGMYDAATMRRLEVSPHGDHVLLPDPIVVK